MRIIYEQWRKYLIEQEGIQPKIVSFDFDDTLIRLDSEFNYAGPNELIIEYFKKFNAAGYQVFIVTSRTQKAENNPDRYAIAKFIKEKNLNPDGIIFTEGKEKVYALEQLGSLLHFDDDEMEWVALETAAPHIKLVKIDYQTGNIIDGLQHIKEIGI